MFLYSKSTSGSSPGAAEIIDPAPVVPCEGSQHLGQGELHDLLALLGMGGELDTVAADPGHDLNNALVITSVSGQ